MRLALLAVVVGMVGCGSPYRPMTNDEVIAESKKCWAAGAKAKTYQDPWAYKINQVICIPPESKP